MKNIKRLPGAVCSSLRSSVYLFDLTRVVEELIFNSIDADSTKVDNFVNVGECYVKVEDDGCGVTREGLVLLGEKHGTSPDCGIPPQPPVRSSGGDQIVQIIDDQTITSSDGTIRQFLVRWSNRPEADDSWVSETELQQTDPDILEYYLSLHSTELSSSQPGRDDGDHHGVDIFVNVGECYVKVEDDGCGVTREGLVLLGEKHATSKVCGVTEGASKFENVDYRGETLSALSDVALLEVITKARGRPNGYHKIIKGCKCISLGIDDSRQDAGTTGSPKKVLYALKKCIIHTALFHPQVSFTVIDIESENELLRTASSLTSLPLVSSYFGDEISRSLHEINVSDGVYKLAGYLSIPMSTFMSKAFQCIYINSRFVSKSPIHKLIGRLAMDYQCSTHICRGEPEVHSCKKQKTQWHALYLLKLSCPVSMYDIAFELSETSVEFKDWMAMLSFLEQNIVNFWKQYSGMPEKNEVDPSYEVNSGGVFVFDASENSKEKSKKSVLYSGWNFAQPRQISCHLEMPGDDFDVYDIQTNSPEVTRRNIERFRLYQFKDASGAQVDTSSQYMVCDRQSISSHTHDIYKTQKFDNDLLCDDIFSLNHNFSITDKHHNLFSRWDSSSGEDELLRQNPGQDCYYSHCDEYSVDALLFSGCSGGLREQESLRFSPLYNLDVSAFSSNHNEQEIDHDDRRTEQISLWTNAEICSLNYNKLNRIYKDKAPASPSSFTIRKCQTKDKLDFLPRDLQEAHCQEERHFAKASRVQNTSCTQDLRDVSSHQFINLDMCLQSPCYPIESVSRSVGHSLDKFVFDRDFENRESPLPSHITDHGVCLEYSHGQSHGDFSPDVCLRTPKHEDNLFLSPNKEFCNGSPSDSQKHYTTQKIRSRRCRSAPPFCKRRSISFTTYNHPTYLVSSKDKNEKFLWDASNSQETGNAFAGLSKPFQLSQPYMNEGTRDSSRTYCSARYEKFPYYEELINDGLKDLTTHKSEVSESHMSKWRHGDPKPTCVDRSYNFSDNKKDVLDISSGLLNLAGSFLEPESINRGLLDKAKVLLQVDKKFIPIVAGGNLAVIDQHAADERIRLEELQRKVSSGDGKKITLLDSERELVLPEMGFQLLQNYSEQIQRWGWICNIDTQASESNRKNLNVLKKLSICGVTLLAVPCILGINLTDKDLVEFLEQLAETDGSSTTPPSVNRVLNLKACRGAIMFGDSLLPSECSLIVEELKTTSLCFQCAHGRPTTAPLVNVVGLHRQLNRLEQQNISQNTDWHSLHLHKPSFKRAQLRLNAAKRFSQGS